MGEKKCGEMRLLKKLENLEKNMLQNLIMIKKIFQDLKEREKKNTNKNVTL